MIRQYAAATAFLVAFTVSTLFGQTPETVSEFDPGIGVGVEVTRRVRLDFFSGREKSDDIGSAKWKVSAGASFRFKSAFPTLLDAIDSDKHHALVVGTAYEYSKASETGGRSIEHKVMLDATARYAIKGAFLLADRNRVEFRWVDGEYRFRYRNRGTLERRLKLKDYKFTPYGAAEAFWDQDFGKWNQFRFTAGSVFPLFPRTSLDAYYERAHCVTCSNPNTNIFAMTVNIFFKRKK